MTVQFAIGVGTAYAGAATVVLDAAPAVDDRLAAAVDRDTDVDGLALLLDPRPHAVALSFAHDDAALHLLHHGAAVVEIDGEPFAQGSSGEWRRHRLLIGSRTSTTIAFALDRHALPFFGSHRFERCVVPAAAVRRSFGPLDDPFEPLDALLCPTTVTAGRGPDVGDDLAAPADRAVGVLVFSTGERLLLDRTVVLGRNPHQVRRLVPAHAPQARLMRVPVPGVSRQHALVRVYGRRVTIDDLGSANGTRVTEPGAATRFVVPGLPVTLVSGAIVELGDGVSFAVEDIA